jgi:Polyketide cyclase / dehydrase and lipid transport
MTQATYTAVLDHPLKTVWALIRDFNNYPAYIEGVSESAIEDDRRGDEVGAIRRFCYRGNWVRHCLAGHSDALHFLTYAGIEPPRRSRRAHCPINRQQRVMKARCTSWRSSKAIGL